MIRIIRHRRMKGINCFNAFYVFYCLTYTHSSRAVYIVYSVECYTHLHIICIIKCIFSNGYCFDLTCVTFICIADLSHYPPYHKCIVFVSFSLLLLFFQKKNRRMERERKQLPERINKKRIFGFVHILTSPSLGLGFCIETNRLGCWKLIKCKSIKREKRMKKKKNSKHQNYQMNALYNSNTLELFS